MSDLGVTIFLLVCCYPVLPIMAAVMANEAKVKKNIAIGCTLPLTAAEEVGEMDFAFALGRLWELFTRPPAFG